MNLIDFLNPKNNSGILNALAEHAVQDSLIHPVSPVFFLLIIILKNIIIYISLNLSNFGGLIFNDDLKTFRIMSLPIFSLMSGIGLFSFTSNYMFRFFSNRFSSPYRFVFHPINRLFFQLDLISSELIVFPATVRIAVITHSSILQKFNSTAFAEIILYFVFLIMLCLVRFSHQSIYSKNCGFFGTDNLTYMILSITSNFSAVLYQLSKTYSYFLALEGVILMYQLIVIKTKSVFFDDKIVKVEKMFLIIRIFAMLHNLTIFCGSYVEIGLMSTILTILGIFSWLSQVNSLSDLRDVNLHDRETISTLLNSFSRHELPVKTMKNLNSFSAFAFQTSKAKSTIHITSNTCPVSAFSKMVEYFMSITGPFELEYFHKMSAKASESGFQIPKKKTTWSNEGLTLTQTYQKLKESTRMRLENRYENEFALEHEELALLDSIVSAYGFFSLFTTNCAPYEVFKKGKVFLKSIDKLLRMYLSIKPSLRMTKNHISEILDILKDNDLVEQSKEFDNNFGLENQNSRAEAANFDDNYEWRDSPCFELLIKESEPIILKISNQAATMLGYRISKVVSHSFSLIFPSFYTSESLKGNLGASQMWLLQRNGYLKKFITHIDLSIQNEIETISVRLEVLKEIFPKCSILVNFEGKIIGLTSSAISLLNITIKSVKNERSINDIWPKFWLLKRIDKNEENVEETSSDFDKEAIFYSEKCKWFPKGLKTNIIKVENDVYEILMFPMASNDGVSKRPRNSFRERLSKAHKERLSQILPSLNNNITLDDSIEGSSDSEYSGNLQSVMLDNFEDSIQYRKRKQSENITKSISALADISFNSGKLSYHPKGNIFLKPDAVKALTHLSNLPCRFGLRKYHDESIIKRKSVEHEQLYLDITTKYLNKGVLQVDRKDDDEDESKDLHEEKHSHQNIKGVSLSKDKDEGITQNRKSFIWSSIFFAQVNVLFIFLVVILVISLINIISKNNLLINFGLFVYNNKITFYSLQSSLVYLNSLMFSAKTSINDMDNSKYFDLMKNASRSFQDTSSEFLTHGYLTNNPRIVQDYYVSLTLNTSNKSTETFTIETLLSRISFSLSETADLTKETLTYTNTSVFFIVFNYLRRFYNPTFDWKLKSEVQRIYDDKGNLIIFQFCFLAAIIAISVLLWIFKTLRESESLEILKNTMKSEKKLMVIVSMTILKRSQIVLRQSQDWFNSVVHNNTSNKLGSFRKRKNFQMISMYTLAKILVSFFATAVLYSTFFIVTNNGHMELRNSYYYNRDRIIKDGLYPHLLARITSIIFDSDNAVRALENYDTNLIPIFQQFGDFYRNMTNLELTLHFTMYRNTSNYSACDFIALYPNSFNVSGTTCKEKNNLSKFYEENIELALQRVIHILQDSFYKILSLRKGNLPQYEGCVNEIECLKLTVDIREVFLFVNNFVIPYHVICFNQLSIFNHQIYKRVRYYTFFWFVITLASIIISYVLSVTLVFWKLQRETRIVQRISQTTEEKISKVRDSQDYKIS